MANWLQKTIAGLTAFALAVPNSMLLRSQDAGAQSNRQDAYIFKANAELVLTNVVVRNAKTGEFVRGLGQGDFTILENGKRQDISTFDFQTVEMATPLNEATISGLAAGVNGPGTKAAVVARPEDLRNHRLIVMFFDLTSMQPEDLDRCVAAARAFLTSKMQPADLVALVSLSDTLKVDQDFTSDRAALANEVGIYNGTEGQGFAQGAGANTNQVEDATGYTPDESEYNDLNTDRELFALRAISKSLAKITEKKSLLYFSGGISRDGIENQASLRAAINSAVRANLSIYSVDTRGLQAISPLGEASTGSLRGSGAFNGAALGNNMNANFATQEVMATLSSDTGGKAFFDSNDFAPAFAQVQRDTSAYYAIGFHSSNPARDGKYRKLTIKVNRPGVKLEYRPGYYAPADFQHSGREDRERELEEQLASDLPATDMAVYLDAMYFRLDENRFFVPVSLIVPGSQIPFVKGGDKDKATLDIIGEVIDEVKRPIGSARETVKLNLDPSLQARQKNIEYTTSFNLPPGKYHLKFVVRENQTGRMGSFEADITLPDLKRQPLKMSSIVLASLRQPSKKTSPLVREGEEYVPNISHVFRQDQHLYLLYEVYGPAREKAAENQPKGTKPGINLLSSLEMIQGSTKVYETPVVQAKAVNVDGRDAVAVELDVPLAGLKAGSYICQLNVVDDAGGSFAFPRFAVLVREPAVALPSTEPAATGANSGSTGNKQTQILQQHRSPIRVSLERRGRMSGSVSGRVAVITGATGGVGAAVARALSKAGYSLVLTAPSMDKLSALAAQLRGPCTVIAGNLSDENLPETLLYAALDRFGHCDICFNNGALFEAGILETVDIERLSSMVRVNVEGSFRVAYVFLKHFVSEGAGHLVNVSSALGSGSRPNAYAATQRAIEVLSDALAAELDDTAVLVSCIQPGLVKTGLRHRWEIAPAGASGAGYPLEPEDFARMVLFILDQSRIKGNVAEPAEPIAEGEQPAGENLGAAEAGQADVSLTASDGTDADESSEEGLIQDEI